MLSHRGALCETDEATGLGQEGASRKRKRTMERRKAKHPTARKQRRVGPPPQATSTSPPQPASEAPSPVSLGTDFTLSPIPVSLTLRRPKLSLASLPPELLCTCLTYLEVKQLMTAELICKETQALVSKYGLWKVAFLANVKRHDWRVPTGERCEMDARSWKPFYFVYARQSGLDVRETVRDISASLRWRVRLPEKAVHFRRRSREFSFSRDALGSPIKWQIEVDLRAPTGTHQEEVPVQTGVVRIWTTNTWTPEMTNHYYGSHCAISLRDNLDGAALTTETILDIDNSKTLMFDTRLLPKNREVLLRIHLTLALEMSAPLAPFYRLLRGDASEAVKVGYCKAIFEIARYKRKHGSTFVRSDDSDAVQGLVVLASADTISDRLRAEAFQALFNLLSPSSVLIPDAVVTELLQVCSKVLMHLPLATRDSVPYELILVQNALGSVFNLLVHPSTRKALCPALLLGMQKMLETGFYRPCWFSVITVLLTALNWGCVSEAAVPKLIHHTHSYIASNDPLSPECTGVAWDETDIAAYFLPLLMSKHLVCVTFARWCVSSYYYGHDADTLSQE